MLYISNIYRDSNDENTPNNSEEENLIELKIKSNGEYLNRSHRRLNRISII